MAHPGDAANAVHRVISLMWKCVFAEFLTGNDKSKLLRFRFKHILDYISSQK